MKRCAAVALALAIALPLCAQRGGGHGGFAAHSASSFRSAPAFHSASAFRGSFARSTPFRYAGGPFVSSRYAPPSRLLSPLSRYAPAISTTRPAFYQRNRSYADRRRHIPFRGVGLYAYPIGVASYWPYPDDYGDLDDLDDTPYDDLSAYGPEPAPPLPDDGSAYPQPPLQAELAPPPPAPAAATPQPPPEPAETVTLIFKDGRPAEQIRNYLATRSTLTVIDGRRHYDIPIADLNLAATVKANREAGVDFQLPTAQ